MPIFTAAARGRDVETAASYGSALVLGAQAQHDPQGATALLATVGVRWSVLDRGERQRAQQVEAAVRAEAEMAHTKLIEGNYPNYKQVIPGEAKERIPLVREELLAALKRAEIMTSEKQNSVKLAFTKNNLAITANAQDVGEARESMAVNYKGKDVAIAFNPSYVIDPLNALPDDEVYLELIDELSPGVLKVNGPFLYVVMPMRLT